MFCAGIVVVDALSGQSGAGGVVVAGVSSDVRLYA